ncbi:35005_t:CDS:2, partial [Racocetra persica]
IAQGDHKARGRGCNSENKVLCKNAPAFLDRLTYRQSRSNRNSFKRGKLTLAKGFTKKLNPADFLIRYVDPNDWCLNQLVFMMLEDRWGPHTIDRMADNQNTKMEQFNSSSNPSYPSTHKRRKGCGNYNRPKMGISGVVANINEYDNRFVAPASSPSIIYQRDFRRSRTVEKPELAVCGSKSRDFCEVMDLRALLAEVDTLVSFIVWLDLTQSFSGCMDVLAAVSRAHLEA